MQYDITAKLGGDDQVGLRFKCENLDQAEKIHLALRQKQFKISCLMESKHPEYTHFVYVTATENQLRQAMSKVETLFYSSTRSNPIQQPPQIALTFQTWQTQFRKAIKTLNSDRPRLSSSSQELDRNNLDREIAAGRATEVEDRLLQQVNSNDSNALRTLIHLYSQTQQYEQIVELCKAKRSEIFGLTASGLLVERLVDAHIQHSQQTSMPQFLTMARELARTFLPELERIQQANGVRQLLHQALNPEETSPLVTGATLSEQLDLLLEIEPGERIKELNKLGDHYPKATAIKLALAESYTAIGEMGKALEVYQSIPEQNTEAQQCRAEILLDKGHFGEVLELLPQSPGELSPAWAGLHGAALYYLGQSSTARSFLEKAWHEGQRNVRVLSPLARLWAEEGDPLQAGTVYQILQDTTDNQFALEDYALMARVANLGGFGDISDEEKVKYYEQCVERSNQHLLNFSLAKEVLSDRLELWQSLQDAQGLYNAYADYFDWLIGTGKIEDLEKELGKLRAIAEQRKFNRQQHFELLEGLEPFVDAYPKLRDTLAGDYLHIAISETDSAIRKNKPEALFFEDLKRALFHLNPEFVEDITQYRQQKRDEAQNLGLQLAEVQTTPETPDLSSLSLALVGGHAATRQAVIQELREQYHLDRAIEISPSSEERSSGSTVRSKIGDCRLIVLITGYMGHDLSTIVSNLKQEGALTGEVLPLACRGKSGVVREILNWWIKQNLR
jgi:Flp pilus assembly protein TadD